MNMTEKMVLGTAQFGMDYGIANISGKPAIKEVFSILDMAWEKGIRCFDTAPGYGSEKVLGEFIEVNGLQDEAKLLTKIPSLEEPSDYRKSIRLNLETSLNHLGCPIDVLFFHNPANSVLLLRDSDFFENLLHDYPISNLGVSVYEPHEVEKLSGSHLEFAFQFPYNILDRRFEHIDMSQGKQYARSIFLQGVLSSKNGLIEDAPEPLLEIQRNYHSLLAEKNIDPIDLAISFVIHAENIDYFLIGVEAVNQLIKILNVKLYDCKKLNEFDYHQFDVNTKWLDPRKWK
jgi:aryl-alcohol dehydrogenase-like predicted oxidoreductase